MLSLILGAVVVLVIVYLLISYVAAYGVVHLDRQPVPKTPAAYGLDFEMVELKPVDGIKLKGWFIPGKLPKIVVMTHVGGLTKYGSTVKFKSLFKLYNQEIEFLKVAQHLHRAGYNVLTFDFRNHGESDKSPNGGKTGVGLEEYKDVVAALDFIHGRADLRPMAVGFVSFCMGANSTIIGMSKKPEQFTNVKCLVAVQPISMSVFVTTFTRRKFTPLGAALFLPMIKKFTEWQSGFPFTATSPRDYVKNIKVPTLYVQTKNDPWTDLRDIKSFYENTPTTKEFFWIENTQHRFEGYSYFQDHPGKMLDWLKKWL